MISDSDNYEALTKTIKENYGIETKTIEKIKNVYKLFDGEKYYCFKLVKYEYGHFLFILSAMKHLQKNGLNAIPDIIHTLSGKDFIKFNNCYCYITEWIYSRHSNYDNPIDLRAAVTNLAILHKKSRNFVITKEMNPRIGWLKWISTFETREKEIFDFKKRIMNKEIKSEFDNMYLKMMDEEARRCESSLRHIIESDYIMKMKKEIANRSFCHHDYANHNVLIGENYKVNIIDFDYCILDSHLHDMASILIRRMKHGKWDMENALYILYNYNSVNSILKNDIPIMAAFIEFPQEYWQIGIQYYWEKQPWSEEVFCNKLKSIENDRVLRQEFVNEFRTCKFGGPNND